jgi:ATP-dependent helicase HepA
MVETLAKRLAAKRLPRLLKPISITQSAGVIRELRTKISGALQLLETRAAERVTSLQEAATFKLSQELNSEADRLVALGSRNGSVRADEVEMIRQIEKDSLEAITRAEARLQGIRVVVAT